MSDQININKLFGFAFISQSHCSTGQVNLFVCDLFLYTTVIYTSSKSILHQKYIFYSLYQKSLLYMPLAPVKYKCFIAEHYQATPFEIHAHPVDRS